MEGKNKTCNVHEINLPTFPLFMKKVMEFQKIFCFIDYIKAFDCVAHNKLENS